VSKILFFSSGPEYWRDLLADPHKQWQPGYSACTLAHCWEATDKFPPEITHAFDQTDDPLLANLSPILAIPEFKVSLPGGTRASQNDIFVLARSTAGPISIMVEGKVNETFGPTIDEWQKEYSHGKEKRLAFLMRSLGLKSLPDGALRYQLLHRAVSAIITAEQYHAVAAVLLIHSFSAKKAGWPDYQAFANLFGVKALLGIVQRLGYNTYIPLFGLWVVGDLSFLQCEEN